MTRERMENAEVSVPAGTWTADRAAFRQTQTFDCEGMESFLRQTIQTFYLVDDVGLVRRTNLEASTFSDEPPLVEHGGDHGEPH